MINIFFTALITYIEEYTLIYTEMYFNVLITINLINFMILSKFNFYFKYDRENFCTVFVTQIFSNHEK